MRVRERKRGRGLVMRDLIRARWRAVSSGGAWAEEEETLEALAVLAVLAARRRGGGLRDAQHWTRRRWGSMVGVMAQRARVAKVRVCRSDSVVGGGVCGGGRSASDEAELLRL